MSYRCTSVVPAPRESTRVYSPVSLHRTTVVCPFCPGEPIALAGRAGDVQAVLGAQAAGALHEDAVRQRGRFRFVESLEDAPLPLRDGTRTR